MNQLGVGSIDGVFLKVRQTWKILPWPLLALEPGIAH